MAGKDLIWKVYDADGDYVAKCAEVADAVMLARLYGPKAKVLFGTHKLYEVGQDDTGLDQTDLDEAVSSVLGKLGALQRQSHAKAYGRKA